MAAKSDPALTAPVILLHGNDEFQVDQRAREVMAARFPNAEGEAGVTTLRGDVDTIDEAIEVLKWTLTAVQSSNLFSAVNVTWLREVGFLSGTVFQNPDVKDRVEGLRELVEKGLGAGQVLLVTVSGKLNANSRFFKTLKQAGHVEEFAKTTKDWEVADEAKARCLVEFEALEARIAPDALDELAERIGNDSRRIRNEVEKLSLCRAEGAVTRADVERMVPAQQEAQVFKLSDCIGRRDLTGAMELLQRMETRGVNPVAAMAMLHNALREMAYLGACLHQGAARIEDRGRFGSYAFTDSEAEKGFQLIIGEKKRSPFRLYQLGKQSKGFSVKQLDRMLRLSAETYDRFFHSPLSHSEQLRLLVLRILYECSGDAA